MAVDRGVHQSRTRAVALFGVVCASAIVVMLGYAAQATARGRAPRRSGWTKPVLITRSTGYAGVLSSSGALAGPFVSVASNGSSVIAWAQGSRHCAIKLRARSASGHLGATQMVTAPGERSVECGFQAKGAANGTAVIIWRHADDSSNRSPGPYFVRVRFPSGALGPIQQLANLGKQYAVVDLAVDSHGRATILLAAQTNAMPATSTVYVQRVEPDGVVDAPATVASLDGVGRLWSLDPERASVGVDRAGDVVLTWVQTDVASRDPQFWARVLFSSGTFGPAIEVATANTPDANLPAHTIVVAPDGRTVLDWGERETNDPTVLERTMNLDGTLGPIKPIGRSVDGVVPFANGAATSVGITTGMNRLVERVFTPGHVGRSRIVASSGCRGCGIQIDDLMSRAGHAWVFWMTDAPYHCLRCYQGVKYTIQARSVSDTGFLGPIELVRTDGFPGPAGPTFAGLDINSNGDAVLVLRERHGEYVTASHLG
jgi:hypothetical protein